MPHKVLLFAAVAIASSIIASSVAAGTDTAGSGIQLPVEKVKTLYRREPRARDLLPKIEQLIATGTPEQKHLMSRRLEFLEDTVELSENLSEEHLHDRVDMLETLTSPCKELSTADLLQLQERYQKLCDSLDDQILIKDLDAALHLHDRFIVLSDMGVWDKNQLLDQLQRMETVIQSAPPIPYGRTELLRSLEGKKLMPPAKGSYVGVSANGEMFLSTDRASVAFLEESTGCNIQLDAATMIIQGPDGRLYDLSSANHPANSRPFSPPISLWMKSRLLEGRIPAVTFELSDPSSNNPQPGLGVQDILDGKLDQYFAKNLKLIAATKATTLVGLFGEFDRLPAATAFGANGRTPYYLLVDPKLSKLSPTALSDQLPHRLSKGTLTRDAGDELRKYYGDPAVPDGPERVRDAWKRLRQLTAENGASYVSLYSCAGAFHGDKKALAFPGCAQAGAQDWNNLQYYCPGNNTLDWIGTAACGNDMSGKPDTYSLANSINQFLLQVVNCDFRSTPVLLYNLGPGEQLTPTQEAAWLSKCFQELLPGPYNTVKAFFLSFPQQINLHSSESLSTYRRAVASTPYFKQGLNLKVNP